MPTITKRGDRWQARVRRRGYPPQSANFRTKGLAEKWARDVEAKIDAGRFQPTPAAAKGLSLGDALRRYLREVTANKEDPKPEQLKLARVLAHPIALRDFATLRASDFAAFRDGLRKLNGKPYSPDTVRLFLAPLSHLYTVARREWGFEGLPNPLLDVTRPTPSPPRTRRANGDELPEILGKARELHDWAPAAIELAVETAMRRADLHRLRWEHVDLQQRVAHLTKTKNGTTRDVPLSSRALALLRSLGPQAEGPVFPVHRDTISKAMIKARQAAGVRGLRLHDLRREATSRLFERGDLSVAEIKQVTGHKTLQQLAVYMAPRPVEIAQKLARKKKPAKAKAGAGKGATAPRGNPGG